MALTLQLTNAGLDAIVDATGGGTDDVHIAEIGLTEQEFVQAPTLTAIPGEFKRLSTLAGQEVAPNVIHMTGYDTSVDVYDVRGFGLYLSDGTLFATHTSAEPVLSKAQLAFGLFSIDVAFSDDVAAAFSFGDNVFLYPPATESVRGVARLATQARVDAVADGADDAETIVTPKTLRARLATLWAAVVAAIGVETAARNTAIAAEATARANADTALAAKTVTGTGMVTGGGAISGDPVLGVAAATAAEGRAGASNVLAMAPATLGPILRLLAPSGYCSIPTGDPTGALMIAWGTANAAANGNTAVLFATKPGGGALFSTCFGVVGGGVTGGGTGAQDNTPEVDQSTISPTGFSFFSAADTANTVFYIAVGIADLTS